MCVGGSGGMRDSGGTVSSAAPSGPGAGSSAAATSASAPATSASAISGAVELWSRETYQDGTRQPRIEERLKAFDEQHGTTSKVQFLTFDDFGSEGAGSRCCRQPARGRPARP